MVTRLLCVAAMMLAASGCCKSKSGDAAEGSSSAGKAPSSAPVSLVNAKAKDKDPGILNVRYAKGGGKYKLRMNPDMTVDLNWRGPSGAKITAGGVSATIDSAGTATTKVALTDPMFKALESWRHKGKSYLKILFNVPIPVTVEGRGAASQDKSLVLTGANILGWYFEQTVMKGKPAAAPGEGDSGGGSFYFLYYPDKKHLHIKRGEGTFKEAKLVVISDYLGAQRKPCGTYVGEKSGKRKKTNISLVSRKLTVYDRRTGKKLGSQTFKGRGRCPSTMKKSYKVYHPDSKAMDAFVGRYL